MDQNYRLLLTWMLALVNDKHYLRFCTSKDISLPFLLVDKYSVLVHSEKDLVIKPLMDDEN